MADVPNRTPQPVPMLDFSRQYADLRAGDPRRHRRGLRLAALHPRPPGRQLRAAAASACAVSSRHRLRQRHRRPLARARRRSEHRPRQTPSSPLLSASSPPSAPSCAAGATPLFADIDPRTFNLSARRRRSRPATPAAATHRQSHPARPPLRPVRRLDAFTPSTQHHNLLLIEDAAQAFGATWNGTPAGAARRRRRLQLLPHQKSQRLRRRRPRHYHLRRHRRRTPAPPRPRHDAAATTTTRSAGTPASTPSRPPSSRSNCATSPSWNQQRRDLAARYDQLFRAAGPHRTPPPNEGIVLPYTDPRATPRLPPVRHPRPTPRRPPPTTSPTATSAARSTTPSRSICKPASPHLGYKPGDFPQSERAAAEVLALPMYPELREDEQQTVVDAIRTFYA